MENPEANRLRVYFLPFCEAGHVIPMLDTAVLFARHGVYVTIIATPANALLFQTTINRETSAGHTISTHVIPFPGPVIGDGAENFHAAATEEETGAVFTAFYVLLREPVERLLRQARPDCLVADMFFPWSGAVAAGLGIRRLVLHTSSYFQHCAMLAMARRYDSGGIAEGVEVVEVVGLPDKVEMMRSQVPEWIRVGSRSAGFEMFSAIHEYEQTSDGVIANSFSEVEGEYEECFMKMQNLKAWSIGPTLLQVQTSYGIPRQHQDQDGDDVIQWLKTKEHRSVLYVGFGSMARFSKEQLGELAFALEACERPFVMSIAVAREEYLPDGFATRVKESGKGFLFKSWAPQREILRQPGVGAMVTHCGWNSVLEGLSSGLPLLTWPLFADQFFNEKLLTEVLRVGMAVGSTEYGQPFAEKKEVVKRDAIARAVEAVMGGGREAEAMKARAVRLAGAAERAVGSGGSSHANLMDLLSELKLGKTIRKSTQV